MRYRAIVPLNLGGRLASIHIGEIALIEITCQECQRRFRVALLVMNVPEQTIFKAIQRKTLHYGDTPRHDSHDAADSDECIAGASMNSEPRHVLEYWRRHDRRYVEGGGSPTPRLISSGSAIHRWRSTFSPNGSMSMTVTARTYDRSYQSRHSSAYGPRTASGRSLHLAGDRPIPIHPEQPTSLAFVGTFQKGEFRT